MSDEQTKLWIHITEIGARQEFTNTKLTELTMKLDEYNTLMRKELSEVHIKIADTKTDIGKRIDKLDGRIIKLEKVRFAGIIIMGFLTTLAGIASYILGVWEKIGSILK